MNFVFWKSAPAPAPVPQLTKACVETVHPEIAVALRSDGARDELERIRGVYKAGSHVTLHPLIERLMFDGRSPPESAALAMVAVMQAEVIIAAEALHPTNRQALRACH